VLNTNLKTIAQYTASRHKAFKIQQTKTEKNPLPYRFIVKCRLVRSTKSQLVVTGEAIEILSRGTRLDEGFHVLSEGNCKAYTRRRTISCWPNFVEKNATRFGESPRLATQWLPASLRINRFRRSNSSCRSSSCFTVFIHRKSRTVLVRLAQVLIRGLCLVLRKTNRTLRSARIELASLGST